MIVQERKTWTVVTEDGDRVRDLVSALKTLPAGATLDFSVLLWHSAMERTLHLFETGETVASIVVRTPYSAASMAPCTMRFWEEEE